MSYKSIIIIILSLFMISSLGISGVINTGFIISGPNRDAEITMEEVPRNITNASDVIDLRWAENVSGVLRYSTSYQGPFPQAYRNVVENYERNDNRLISVLGRELEVGLLYCIILAENGDYSAVFRIIRAAEVAPERLAPITSEGREGIRSVTPSFRWRSVEGVPYYHLLVSDQPFEIIEDDSTGETRVEGANIIWQAITSETSLMYGVADPSEYFEIDNIPPLIGSMDRQDRPRYAWLVLNNYGNHPAYSSQIVGGVSGFEIEVDPPFGEPENIAPEQATEEAEDEVVFRWTPVRGASSYFIYVSREEITPGGSQALLPAWFAQTTLTSISCPAGNIFQEGRYIWKIIAANEQGRGTISDTTSFNYLLESGFVSFQTNTVDGDYLQFVELIVDPIEGAALPVLSTDDLGYHGHHIPVGIYRFIFNKAGYAEVTSDELEIEFDEEEGERTYDVTVELEALPSSIVGTCVNGEDEPQSIAGANLIARNIQTDEEVRTETNISGEYQLDVMAGSYNISASADGHEPTEERPLRVEVGVDYDLNAIEERGPFVLPEYTFTVSGVVQNPSDQPIQLAQVEISNEEENYRTSTPESGRYSFTIGIGDWSIIARKPGFYLESGDVEIEIIDRDIDVNFTLVPQAGILSGQVLVNGTPGRGAATVWCIPDAGDVIIAQTNRIGSYSQGLAPGDYIVTPVLEGYSTDNRLELTIGPGATISGVELELTANPSSISGRIMDNDDQALRNALVSAAGVRTNSDAQGNYTLDVAAGDHIVSATLPGYVSAEEGPVGVEPGEDVANININLTDNAGVISGRVRRGNDAIFNAIITAVNIETENEFEESTDRNGNYTFGLRHGLYRVTVHKDGFVAAQPGFFEIQLRPGQEVNGRDFPMLNYAARLTGVVRSPAGPVNSPSIRITQLDDENRVYNTSGNVEGRFALTVAPEASYIVRATKDGFSTDELETDSLGIEGEADIELEIVALPCRLDGRITVDESPLSGVEIRAVGEEDNYEVTSDRMGFYNIDLESGAYTIFTSKPGYTEAERDVELTPGENREDVDFSLEENFSLISGTIFDPDDEPIEGTQVILIETVSNRRFNQTTQQDGQFSFGRLIPGTYRIQANHLRYASGNRNIGELIGGRELTRQNLELQPLESRIEGFVTSNDQPVQGARVFAILADQEFTTQTNDQGVFVFPHVGQGNYDFLPAKVGFTGEELEDVEVNPGDTLIVELTMIRNDGEITGSVIDPDEAGLRGARVTASDALGNFAGVETNAAGVFSLENLYPRSQYTVTVQLAGYFTENDTVENVDTGAEVIFEMIPNSLRMAGSTKNQDGAELSNTPITITSLADGSEFNTNSDENGNFTFSGLARNTSYRIQTGRFEEIYLNVDQRIQTEMNHLEGGSAVHLVLIESSASISGSVGVREVIIEAYHQQAERTTTVYSGADGTYGLSNLRNGNYTISASRVGFRVIPESLPVNNLRVAEERSNINFNVEEIRVNLTGSVVDQVNQPFPSVRVIAWSVAGQFIDTTDQNGNFQFQNVYPNQSYQVATLLPSDGYDNSTVELEIGESNRSGISLSVVRHNATIKGRIYSGSDDLDSCIVTLDNALLDTTDDNGNYEFNFLGGGNHTIAANKVKHVGQEVTQNTGIGEDTSTVDIELQPLTSALFGRVKIDQPEHVYLSNALLVLVDSENNDTTTYSTLDGSYNFNNLNTNLTYTLTTSKKGFETRVTSNISIGVNSQEHNPQMPKVAASITGTLYDSENALMQNAIVKLRSFDNSEDYDTTDEVGDFTFITESGSFMLMGIHPDDGKTSYNQNVTRVGDEPVFKNLNIRNSGVILGEIIDDSGNVPNSSGRVLAQHRATGTMIIDQTNVAGKFLMRGLRLGDQTISVEAPAYAMVSGPINVSVGASDTTRITVELTQSGKAIAGLVLDQDFTPISQVRVSVEGPTNGCFLTNGEGYWSLSDPEAGQYTVSVEKIGFDAPDDTTFTLDAGEIAQIDRMMNLTENSVSGKVFNEFSEPMFDVKVFLIQNDEPLDSTLTNEFGEYQFPMISEGFYSIQAVKETYQANPEVHEIEMIDNESFLNVNFIMTLVRGIGSVTGVLYHGAELQIGAEVTMRDLSTNEVYRYTSDAEGEFDFNEIPAPATLQIRAVVDGFAEKLDSTFVLPMDSTRHRVINFPTGQISVVVLDIEGNALLNRPVFVRGIDVDFDSTLFADDDGVAETINWLKSGLYSVVPETEPGELAPEPAIVPLGEDEQVPITWRIGVIINAPPQFNADEESRVEIQIPAVGFTVDSGSLFWQSPGSVIWESVPLQEEGTILTTSGRNLRSTATLNYRTLAVDETRILYGFIPPQNRSGTLLYYLKVSTREGFTFGGVSTVQEVQITNRGLLDYLKLTRTLSGFLKLQIGVPIELIVNAYDDADTNLTNQLTPEAVTWTQIGETLGELTVNPDTPIKATYLPQLEGPAKIGVKVTQDFAGITIRNEMEWTNKQLVLGRMSIGPINLKVAAGDSGLLNVSAIDTNGASIPVLPVWSLLEDDSLLGVLEPVPYTLKSWFHANPWMIGRVRIEVADSLTGQLTYFNEEEAPDEASRGLPIYGIITKEEADTLTFTDGTDFKIRIPPGAVENSGAEISLDKPALPAVMRVTPLYQSSEIGFNIDINGSVNDNVGYIITLPVPEDFRDTDPKIGVWSNQTVQWDVLDGEFSDDHTTIDVIVNQLAGLYAFLGVSEPLNIQNLEFHPNPFSPDKGGLSIEFWIDSNESDNLFLFVKIFNMSGQLVRSLKDGIQVPKGNIYRDATDEKRRVIWDGLTDDGYKARNGRYVVVVTAKDASGEKKQIGTAVLIK